MARSKGCIPRVCSSSEIEITSTVNINLQAYPRHTLQSTDS